MAGEVEMQGVERVPMPQPDRGTWAVAWTRAQLAMLGCGEQQSILLHAPDRARAIDRRRRARGAACACAAAASVAATRRWRDRDATNCGGETLKSAPWRTRQLGYGCASACQREFWCAVMR
jgi:hypothetical protein